MLKAVLLTSPSFLLSLLENPVNVTLYAVIDSFHDIKEEQMVRKLFLHLITQDRGRITW